jgi:excisionase family DNA binding protein
MLLNAKQTAEYLNVRLSTIRKWTHEGLIPRVKMKGAVRYDQTKLDDWIEKRSADGRSKQKVSAYEANPRIARKEPSQPATFTLK